MLDDAGRGEDTLEARGRADEPGRKRPRLGGEEPDRDGLPEPRHAALVGDLVAEGEVERHVDEVDTWMRSNDGAS